MATSPNNPNDITSTLEANNSPVAESAGEWIRFRAVLWALLFSPITAFWAVDQGVDVIFSLMVPPVMMTLLMAGINLLLRKFAPRLSLSMGDLIIFYGMHTVLCAICAEWMSVINPYIHSYALYRSGDTRFDKYINPYISDWFFIPVRLADQFEDYRNGGFGGSYFLTKLPLWWRYIGAWTLLVSLVCLAMLCINSLFRDEWANREKLAFPIIQVPMEIAKIGVGQSKIWKKPTFYIPFITMFVIDNINGLHFVYPSVPLINVRFISDLALLFPNPPLNAVGWTPIGVFPYMAVIGFFMPTDLLFSCIFFFFFRKGMQVFTFSMGYVDSAGTFGGGGLVPSPPYFSEQSWGHSSRYSPPLSG